MKINFSSLKHLDQLERLDLVLTIIPSLTLEGSLLLQALTCKTYFNTLRVSLSVCLSGCDLIIS